MNNNLFIQSSDKSIYDMSAEELFIFLSGAKVYATMLYRNLINRQYEPIQPATNAAYVYKLAIEDGVQDSLSTFRFRATSPYRENTNAKIDYINIDDEYMDISEMDDEQAAIYMSGAESFSQDALREILSREYKIENKNKTLVWVYTSDIENAINECVERISVRVNNLIDEIKNSFDNKNNDEELNEIVEIYTNSKTFDDIREIEEYIAEIRTYTGYNYEEIARLAIKEPNGKNILVELQVSTKDMLDEGYEFVCIGVYEYEGNLEDFSADEEIDTIDFDFDWKNAINTMRSLAQYYSE